MAARELIIENFDFSKRHRLIANYKERGAIDSETSLGFQFDIVTPSIEDGFDEDEYYTKYTMSILLAKKGESWYTDEEVTTVFFYRITSTQAMIEIKYESIPESSTNDVELIYELFDTQLDFDGEIRD